MSESDNLHDIELMREAANDCEAKNPHRAMCLRAAASLLSVHVATGISLDGWEPVREFVESMMGHPIEENGA